MQVMVISGPGPRWGKGSHGGWEGTGGRLGRRRHHALQGGRRRRRRRRHLRQQDAQPLNHGLRRAVQHLALGPHSEIHSVIETWPI